MRDSDLRQRLIYGDHAALAEVYDVYGATVYTVALRVTQEPEVAEQVALDVFVGLWDRPLSYDPGQASLAGWLAMLAHRRSVEWLRQNSVDPASQPTPAALHKLPPLTMRAIELAYFKGRTYRQVAVELGIPESTAKSRLRAGLRELAGDR